MNDLYNLLFSLPWEIILQAISTVSTILAASIIIFAMKQLRFEAWTKAEKMFVEDKFKESRKIIFSYLVTTKEQHDEQDIEHFFRVCQSMDRLCHLEPFLGKYLFSNWYDSIGKAWFVVQKYVQKERTICDDATKWKAFERIGSKALKKLRKENREPKLNNKMKII